MKCQGKTNRATSANCTSGLLAAFNSSTTNRKLRSRKTIRRKSRKPAVLPCSLNECHPVEDENGSSEQPLDAEAQDAIDVVPDDVEKNDQPTVKTVETTLEGGNRIKRADNDDDEKLNEDADKEAQGDETDSQLDDSGSQEDGSDPSTKAESSTDGDTTNEDEEADELNGDRKKKKKKRPKIIRPTTAAEAKPPAKHIHPCICDLSTKAQARIKAHIKAREEFEMRHTKRLESIDAELRAIEEEIARKQQEELEQQELFGDKYEVIGKKKKRMKRSARRASMVSLGVKQVISWKKSPKIKVRYTQTSNLRKNFTSYCGDRPLPLPALKKMGFEQSPKIPVRITKAASLRSEFNIKKKQYLVDNEDKRPRFDVSPFY